MYLKADSFTFRNVAADKKEALRKNMYIQGSQMQFSLLFDRENPTKYIKKIFHQLNKLVEEGETKAERIAHRRPGSGDTARQRHGRASAQLDMTA